MGQRPPQAERQIKIVPEVHSAAAVLLLLLLLGLQAPLLLPLPLALLLGLRAPLLLVLLVPRPPQAPQSAVVAAAGAAVAAQQLPSAALVLACSLPAAPGRGR